MCRRLGFNLFRCVELDIVLLSSGGKGGVGRWVLASWESLYRGMVLPWGWNGAPPIFWIFCAGEVVGSARVSRIESESRLTQGAAGLGSADAIYCSSAFRGDGRSL